MWIGHKQKASLTKKKLMLPIKNKDKTLHLLYNRQVSAITVCELFVSKKISFLYIQLPCRVHIRRKVKCDLSKYVCFRWHNRDTIFLT